MHFRTNVGADQLKLDPSKPTIMVVSDSAAIHTGFAQVVRNVLRRLWPDRKWNIVQFGWWHSEPVERIPWPIITTERHADDPRFASDADKYGELSFERVVGEVKPDLVLVIGDPWMIGPVLDNANRGSYKLVLYIPVDGAPLMYAWNQIKNADVVVPYAPWGKKMIERWCPDVKPVDPIPHGVDTTTYKPINEGERVYIKREEFHVGEKDIIMMSVSRNQARKNIPALVELTRCIREGDYRVCQHCGRAYRNPFDYHMGKPSGRKGNCEDFNCILAEEHGHGECMLPGKPHPEFYYYIHTPIKDLEPLSWRLLDVLDAFGIREELPGDSKKIHYPGFRWNEQIRIVHGMSEMKLAQLMAAADIFSVATTGEGWGLPLLEAMACGTPTVAPDISAHPDFMRGAGKLIDIDYHVCEVLSTYFRGYPDMDHYLTVLLKLIEDVEYRKEVGAKCRERALEYSWDGIADQWRDLINRELGDVSTSKRWHKLTTV